MVETCCERGRGQRVGGGLEFVRGGTDDVDDFAYGALEIVGELVHVGLALLRDARFGFLLLGFQLNLGETVLLEDERGFGDVANLVLALGAVDVDLEFSAGERLQQIDHRPERLGDTILTDHEAQQHPAGDAGERDDDQQFRLGGIFLRDHFLMFINALAQAVNDRPEFGPQCLRRDIAFHHVAAQLLGRVGQFGGRSSVDRCQRRFLILLIGRKRLTHTRDKGPSLRVARLRDNLKSLVE